MRESTGDELGCSRRALLESGARIGLGALILSALPVAERLAIPRDAVAAGPADATLQAYADTILPGRPATRTDLGDQIHPGAIAGVDPEPGAVEADALRLFDSTLLGFPLLAPVFLADLAVRALANGGPFLSLPFDARVATVQSGLDFENPDRVLHEAAAAIPFVAFCAAGSQPGATAATASGYRVMGYPGAAPSGYRNFSYGRALARERTSRGSLG